METVGLTEEVEVMGKSKSKKVAGAPKKPPTEWFKHVEAFKKEHPNEKNS